ncbi:hypothetical protein Vafri_21905 [Volvox africanus]|uniref:Uncharacterized protein n=2 Tax=Volvox africanus TaxID=51714 RepID=A0A8J4FEE7_9CHLO|nr:hypothetical protein Vafri_21905 [Volvox africanus]
MSSSIGNGDFSTVPQDKSMARPQVSYPLGPSSEQPWCAQQHLLLASVEKVDDLKPCDTESKEVLKGATEIQACTRVTDMTASSAKVDRPASRDRFVEYFERSQKLKEYIFETQLFCAQAAWRAQEVRMQVMDPKMRKTCEEVAEVRQLAAQLEMEAAVRRGDKLQVEMDEAKKQLSSLAAREQQSKLQLADSTAQLEDARNQLQRMQADKEEQIAAARREAAASHADLEALREQLRLAQQQVAQQQWQYAAAAAVAAPTTAATAGTTFTPSAGDVDMELAAAPSPIAPCAAAANWATIASPVEDDALWKEVNALRAELVEVKADGRDTAERLRAMETKCDAVLGALDAVKWAQSTPASRRGRRAPAAATTPSPSPCLPASVGVTTRSMTRARKGLFSPPAPVSGKRTQRDDGAHDCNDDDVAVKRLRTN